MCTLHLHQFYLWSRAGVDFVCMMQILEIGNIFMNAPKFSKFLFWEQFRHKFVLQNKTMVPNRGVAPGPPIGYFMKGPHRTPPQTNPPQLPKQHGV